VSGKPQGYDCSNTVRERAPEAPFPEAISAAIVITDSAGVITHWNPFAERLYGWRSNEVIGHNIMEITVSKETEQQAKEHLAALGAGGSWSGEFEVRCKNGGFLTALVTLSPVVDDRGTTIHIVGVSQDLTGRKQTEDELRKIRTELEKRVQEGTAELNKANESLRDLSARLLKLRDEEARRLARELHDSVGQLLAAISMNIAKVQSQSYKLDEAGAKAVAEDKLLIEQVNNEVRTISHLLHPPLLDELGLGSTLRSYVDEFSERSMLKTQLEISSDFGRLSTDLETAVFRIVQECLTNIRHHSGSKTGAIRIFRQNGEVIIVAQDSGKGISPDKLSMISDGRSGVGFRGMRERIRRLGGTLEIHSDRRGTVITASLPLEQAEWLIED
jgi:PAS domain S-box-containing protein